MARLFLRDGVAAYVGHLDDNSEHSHWAVQLVLVRKGLLTVTLDGQPREVPGVLIPSQVPHRVEFSGGEDLILLHGPSQRFTRYFQGRGPRVLDQELVDRLVGPGEGDPAGFFTMVDSLVGPEGPQEGDPRIRAVARHVAAEENCRHRLADLAKVAGLSPSRLTHLFREELGVSLKHYCLWNRTLFAIDSMRSTRDLTAVALSCGFSDLSHLSRTFHQLFGVTIRQVFQSDRSVQVTFLGD